MTKQKENLLDEVGGRGGGGLGWGSGLRGVSELNKLIIPFMVRQRVVSDMFHCLSK